MSKIFRFLCSIFVFLSALTNLSCAHQQNPEVKAKNYIPYDLEYVRYQGILEKLVKKVGTLKNRGEAHITLVTPPEFARLTDSRTSKLTPDTALEIYRNFSFGSFKEICLGRVTKNISGKDIHTYFVVVQNPAFVQFRKLLAEKAQIDKSHFDPELFFPHITIGFTERDIHYEEGALKNESSCLGDFKLP